MNRLKLFILKTKARRMAIRREGCESGNREAAKLRTVDEVVGFYFDHLPGIVQTRQIDTDFIRHHFATERGEGLDFVARYKYGVVAVSENRELELKNDPVVYIPGASRCCLLFDDGTTHRVFVRDTARVEIHADNGARVLVSAYDKADIVSETHGEATTRVVLHGNTATHTIKNHGENLPITTIKKS